MPLKQEYDSMFERNIAIIASRKQEVYVEFGDRLYEGFVCGLDDLWLQIYGHDVEDREDPTLAWRFVLINKDKIVTIRTSGRDLRSLPEDAREWVEKRISAFANIAEKFSVRKHDTDDYNR